MQKIKQIKKYLKLNNLYQKYINKYQHHQMKFLPTKILLSLNKDVAFDVLIEIEKKYLKADKSNGTKMFIDVFKKYQAISNFKSEWESFSIMMFYVYQSSTYYKDKKHNIDNVFINDIIANNVKKRESYYTWMNSLDYKEIKTNLHLKKILKLVL